MNTYSITKNTRRRRLPRLTANYGWWFFAIFSVILVFKGADMVNQMLVWAYEVTR